METIKKPFSDAKKLYNKKLKLIDQEKKVSTIEKKGEPFKLFYNKNIYGDKKGLILKDKFITSSYNWIMKSLLYIVSLYIQRVVTIIYV